MIICQKALKLMKKRGTDTNSEQEPLETPKGCGSTASFHEELF